jgi:hypothetical protein
VIRSWKYAAFWVAVAAVALWWFTGDTPLDILQSILSRGRQLTMITVDENGDAQEDLVDLCDAAGEILGSPVEPSALILAIMSGSEHGAAGAKEKALMQRVAMNRGGDLVQVITNGNGLGKQGSKRPFATSRDAYEDDLTIAHANLDGALPDDSFGAEYFVHRTGFASVTGYGDTCRKWFASMGIVPVDVGGVGALRVFIPLDRARQLGLDDEAKEMGFV